MNNKSLYLALSVAALMIMIAPVLVSQEQNSTPSASEQRAMTSLKNMSQYLANAEHFSVTIRDDYDAVQASGEKIQFGSLRKVTVSRPDRLRIEVERSGGEKGLVLFNGKDITWGGYYAGLATAGAAGVAMGATVASLPAQSTPITVQGNPYYYSGGVYYAPSPQGNGYAAVPPPKGAVIPSVPDSSTSVYGAGKSFAYSNGVFYEPAGQGYKIVQPPVGVLVASIPEGATTVTVNGAKYFEFGGIWYRPFYSGSDVVYQISNGPQSDGLRGPRHPGPELDFG